jgi:hypothetical protein
MLRLGSVVVLAVVLSGCGAGGAEEERRCFAGEDVRCGPVATCPAEPVEVPCLGPGSGQLRLLCAEPAACFPPR